MNKIPVVISPLEDELLISWLLRLTQANMLSDLVSFQQAFVYPNTILNRSSSPKLDSKMPFEYFYRSLPSVISERELFFKTSTFTAVAPFLIKEQRQRLICNAFNTNEVYAPLFPAPHSLGGRLNICLKCANEELRRHGFYYIHRSHNISGVTLCYKHGCPLCSISNRTNNLKLDAIPNTSSISVKNSALEYQYALFAKDFLDNEFDCSLDVLRNIVLNRLKKDDINNMAFEGYADLISSDIGYFLTIGIKQNYISPSSFMATLLYLFTDVSSLKSLIVPSQVSESFAKAILREGYEMVGTYRDDLIMLRHNDCNHIFCTSPYGFSIGWRCPRCDKRSLQKKYEEIIMNVGEKEYEPINEFISMDKPILVRHKECGQVLSKKARAFIYERRRCNCNYRINAKEMVEQFDGFELSYYSRTDIPLRIKHICGGEFSVYYSKFISDPRCRICQRKGHLAARTSEDMRNDIYDLVGDEYTLIGEYNGPHDYLSIRHNKCNTISKYRPYYFLDGGRCPFCHNDITESELKQYVSSFTFGKYKVDKKLSKNMYEVVNTATMETVNISALKMLQELHRPTPSPLLPLDATEKNTNNVTPQSSRRSNMVLQYLRTHYTDEPVFIEDVSVLDMDSDEKATVFGNLSKKGLLVHLATGVYGFPDVNYTDEQLIYHRYIKRNGNRIGFFRKDSFAFEIGLINDKPLELSVATNKESFKTANRKTHFLGKTIHIKGVPSPVSNTNYLILETIDFLLQYKQCTNEQLENIFAKIRSHIREQNGAMLEYDDFRPYIDNYKAANIHSLLKRLITKLCNIAEEEYAED